MQLIKGKEEAGERARHPVRPWPRALSALQYRNFRLFWSGQLVSLIGTWMQATGQAWLVLQLTHSAWWLGVIGAMQFVPILIFGLFNGVIADSFPKRRLLLFTQTTSMILAAILGLLVLTNTVQLWHVFVLAALLGTTNSLDLPVRQAFVVEMVGKETLPNAIALNSTVFNMARIVGPGIAGLLIGWVGEASLFTLNALSFLPVIAGIFLINSKELQMSTRKQGPKQNTLKSMQEGLAYVWQTPIVLLIIGAVTFISLFGVNFNVVLPLYAEEILKVGPEGFGFISSALGIGALSAAVWLAWQNKMPGIKQMLIGGFFLGVFEIAFALTHVYAAALVLIAASGFAQIMFAATANATIQAVTPHHLRGRIMSVYTTVFAGSTPLGNLYIGGLAHLFNATFALLAAAIPCALAAVIAWIVRGPAEKNLKEM